jgi:hypothetical protein
VIVIITIENVDIISIQLDCAVCLGICGHRLEYTVDITSLLIAVAARRMLRCTFRSRDISKVNKPLQGPCSALYANYFHINIEHDLMHGMIFVLKWIATYSRVH